MSIHSSGSSQSPRRRRSMLAAGAGYSALVVVTFTVAAILAGAGGRPDGSGPDAGATARDVPGVAVPSPARSGRPTGLTATPPTSSGSSSPGATAETTGPDPSRSAGAAASSSSVRPTGSAPYGDSPDSGNDGFARIQAETFQLANDPSPIKIESIRGGGRRLSNVRDGDWVVYRGYRWGADRARQVVVRLASASSKGGRLQIRLDGPTVPPVATLAVADTGGWSAFTDRSATVTGVTGSHDVYLTFTSSAATGFVDVDWLSFRD